MNQLLGQRTFVNIANGQFVLTGSGLVAFLALAHFSLDAIASMFSALLPSLQQRFGLAESTLALLVATLAFSTSFTQPLFGTLADRIGRRPVGALGLILNTVLLSLIGVAPTVYLLVGLLLVGGLGSAALHPTGASMARAVGGRHRELAVSLFGTGGTLGVALGPVIVLLLVSRLGLETTPWLMIPGVLIGLLMLLVVPDQERCATKGNCPKFFDSKLLIGPVGLLSLVGIFSGLASVTFGGAMPLWLVQVHDLAPDAPLIGWTLAIFSLAAVLGGVIAGVLSSRISRRWLVAGSMALAPLPLWSIFLLEPGSTAYFLVVMAAGSLMYAGAPLLVVSAQDLAPHAVATASGMLGGLAAGTAGILYVGIGRLQELIGLAPAMSFTYLMPILGAILAFYVLTRYQVQPEAAERGTSAEVEYARTACLCALCVVSGVTTDLPYSPIHTAILAQE